LKPSSYEGQGERGAVETPVLVRVTAKSYDCPGVAGPPAVSVGLSALAEAIAEGLELWTVTVTM
jgi:hypothetical protein